MTTENTDEQSVRRSASAPTNAEGVRDRPIIFSGPMVQAILAGRKTQTRRKATVVDMGRGPRDGDRFPGFRDPGFRVGGKLWVKESYAPNNPPSGYSYKADGTGPAFWGSQSEPAWKSGRFMPKVVARIWLEVTEVRLQLLQEITYDDAKAEGAFATFYGSLRPEWSMVPTTSHEQCLGSPQMAFANAWNRIHGGEIWNCKPGPSPWDENPHVFAITFRRITP